MEQKDKMTRGTSMRILNKNADKDFIVLNLTDTQLSNEEWAEGTTHRRILERTITELIARVSPDLITVSGDLAWAGHDHAYDMLASFLDSFGIPWAIVWGNHDNQNGAEYIDSVATRYMTYPNCIYEKGESALGNGNYVISIEQDGKSLAGIFMIDSHDRSPYIDADGNEHRAWAKLNDAQKVWFGEQIEELKQRGCADATVIMHIPIYAFRDATAAAYKSTVDHKSLTLENSLGRDCWNEGYEDSIGVQYEGIGSYPTDDGMLDVLKASGITKRIVVGHDHINNWIIDYEGIRFVYSLKTGAGCYWNPILNGGTVLKIGADGVYDVVHEYVDTSDIK